MNQQLGHKGELAARVHILVGNGGFERRIQEATARRGAHGAGAKTEVVLRVCSSERLARSAAPACSGEGLAWGASCVPIRNGRVTKRSASACEHSAQSFTGGCTCSSLGAITRCE